MKRFIISAVLLTLGSFLITSCTTTTVPRENNVQSSTSRTYSK